MLHFIQCAIIIVNHVLFWMVLKCCQWDGQVFFFYSVLKNKSLLMSMKKVFWMGVVLLNKTLFVQIQIQDRCGSLGPSFDSVGYWSYCLWSDLCSSVTTDTEIKPTDDKLVFFSQTQNPTKIKFIVKSFYIQSPVVFLFLFVENKVCETVNRCKVLCKSRSLSPHAPVI